MIHFYDEQEDINLFNYEFERSIYLDNLEVPLLFSERPWGGIYNLGRNTEQKLKEMKSDNKNFLKEKDVKFELYPLYINWKKIDKQSFEGKDNYYFNIFKIFGYFGEAIYEILIKSVPKTDYFTHNNFLNELYKLYKKEYTKEELEKNIFYKNIKDIYEDTISLIKNKIIIFKEIPIFLIILKFYQSIFSSLKDKNNAIESLRSQFVILSYLKNEEYEKIYNTHLKKFSYSIFQRNKIDFIKRIKKDYKIYSLYK